MSAADKLLALRGLFSSPAVTALTGGTPLSAYLLPSTDAHQSEYLADYDFRVKFLSNFSGSNAYVVVTEKNALLWTDGRYFVQAAKQLDDKLWTLMKQAQPDSITVEDYLISNLAAGNAVGFDPFLLTYDAGSKLLKKLNSVGLKPVAINENLVDKFWTDRPTLSNKKVDVLNTNEHGQSTCDKLTKLREKLKKQKCDAIVLGALDDIVWMLNIRGFDIPYNPLVYSYMLITLDEAHLFIDDSRLDDASRAHLSNIHIHNYTDAQPFISKWRESNKTARVFVPTSTNYAIGSIFGENSIQDDSPVMKAVKNGIEIQNMRTSSIRDSAALVQFFYWLEQEIKAGKTYNEFELADKIDGLRAKMEKFVDLSFTTISAVGDHSALPHYHPDGDEGNRTLHANQVFLLDSGAHYRDGTTDVTRTIWTGDVSTAPADFIRNNTLVLKGHIHLAQTLFPSGINGVRLDTLSRHALWQQGLDFGHGTGHGVGMYLNVHEGPIGIGFRTMSRHGDLKSGNVITIEPGYYLPQHYGVRIENCYELVSAEVNSGSKDFLRFEPLSWVPIQTAIIDKSLLNEDQVKWLNSYHDKVLELTGGFLKSNGMTTELEWLQKQCEHI
ncbi:hypothetical protein WR25_21475 [Diploscapter pachys]|uniref:Aminopeptidase P N-terminal domain-containing protein n=1 Tax=Diploscapter pachys TaxID=2018661 RepID=A0A2A2JEX2_9BILA|nr:hypothetical protein WR25_21475 [Diploscapter pachys]